jgi:hypothetical protein
VLLLKAQPEGGGHGARRRRANGAGAGAIDLPKAGLTGRAALSAFFLEDLLAPIEGVE